ncbi:hypothetical protein [Oenococcus oeni]|uniref:Uncharacterized protein n=1 Tax=Oenococcus oeni TaxID=1247 RepID=A0AAJ2P336_OENOE|nr:hypothetical protein [Oenococcus oeni]MDV7715260.1 hypothetical protein [Oenococcus oeni]
MITYISLGIAILGAITGVSGLMIQIFQYLNQKPKMVVKQIDNDNCFMDDDIYAVIELEFINKSQVSLSITGIKIIDEDSQLMPGKNYEFLAGKHFKFLYPYLQYSEVVKAFTSIKRTVVLYKKDKFNSKSFNISIETPAKTFGPINVQLTPLEIFD